MNKTEDADTGPPRSDGAGSLVLRWVLFFLITLGLGYAAVSRYDPRQIASLSDSLIYTRLVAGEPVMARDSRFRIMVPYVARPFYWLAKGRLGPERAALLALLIANSIFCATSASLLVVIAFRVIGDLSTAILSALLYLSSLAIPHLQLAGMIDSGEACLALALTFSLLTNRWWLLPLWALLGALTKETFVPLAALFAIAWWFILFRRAPRYRSQLWWPISVGVVGLATVTVLQSVISGYLRWPWQIEVLDPGTGYLTRVVDSLLSPSFWYVFAFLIPFGVWRLRSLPREWVFAAAAAALGALALGLYKGVGPNVARPIFDFAAPMLSVSVALLITRIPGCATNPGAPNRIW
ncbi:MAG: hypothetical protein ABI596_04115 [Pyrinomonadaceae bacterium]